MRAKLLRATAWIVTAGLLGVLFWRTPFAEVAAALHNAAGWTAPAAVAVVAAIYLADSFAIWKTFGWFLARLSFAQVLVVRGATYLLAVINYNIGQAAIVYFIHRATGAPVLRGVGTVLLIMGINLVALLALAALGLVVAPDVPPGLLMIILAAAAGLAVYAVVVATRPRWLAKRPIFDVLLHAGIAGHLKALAVRLPHIASLVLLHVLVLRGFGVQVPLEQAVVCLPIVFFIAVLPISVQGLGTTQAAMIFFFARYAPGATSTARDAVILAASLSSQAIAVAFQSLLGLACLRSRTGRKLKEAASTAPAEGARSLPSAGAQPFDLAGPPG